MKPNPVHPPLPGEPDSLLGHLGRGRGSDWSDSHGRGAARSHPHQPWARPTQPAASTGHLQQPKLPGKHSRHRCEAWAEAVAGWVNREPRKAGAGKWQRVWEILGQWPELPSHTMGISARLAGPGRERRGLCSSGARAGQRETRALGVSPLQANRGGPRK